MTLRCSGVYSRLVAAEAPVKDAEIVRDLNRTYPSHVYYQQRQGPGQLSLYNVLKAFSLYDAKVRASLVLSITGVVMMNIRDC
jgi:Rab-GTPase-TBC domain